MLTSSRVLSVVLVLIYVIVACISDGIQLAAELGIFLCIPLALIWFSDAVGAYTGHYKVQITSPTPGVFIAFAGWLLLLSPVLVAIIVSCSR